MIESGRYYAAVTTDDVWICYPWEAKYVSASEEIRDSWLTFNQGY